MPMFSTRDETEIRALTVKFQTELTRRALADKDNKFEVERKFHNGIFYIIRSVRQQMPFCPTMLGKLMGFNPDTPNVLYKTTREGDFAWKIHQYYLRMEIFKNTDNTL